jgi:hypothetical protein
MIVFISPTAFGDRIARKEDAGVGSGFFIISCALCESLGKLAYIAGKSVTQLS